METTIQKPRQRNQNNHSALEKAKAVLSVWGERRKVSEVCREMNVQWNVLQMWQSRALEGMLQALEPRVNLEQGAALSPKLLRMLEKKRQIIQPSIPPENRLEEKLVKIEASRNSMPKVEQKTSRKTIRK